MHEHSIVSKKLVVRKGDSTILDGLTFEVKQGALTGLIGPSGSGKTTLMRCIAGLQSLTSGTLMINNKPAGSPQLRKQIGYVTQAPSIYEDLTVEQNLKYFAVLVRANKQTVEKVLKQVDLTEQRKQLTQSLSGGQRTRVSLAIALLGDADTLILDEPTVGLDPVLRRSLWGLFEKLANSGRTIIVSSHVMDEADRCDDILLLREGYLLWTGSRSGLLKKTGSADTESAFLKLAGDSEK